MAVSGATEMAKRSAIAEATIDFRIMRFPPRREPFRPCPRATRSGLSCKKQGQPAFVPAAALLGAAREK